MVTIGVFPFQGKTHIVEPKIEPGTSWLVVRSSDQAGQIRNISQDILSFGSGLGTLSLQGFQTLVE